jgi:hypothetical protein
MVTRPKVDCKEHGPQDTAFVCQHIADGLTQHRAVGFFWSRDDKGAYPDAWCSEREARVRKTGGEWVGEALDNIGAKILCSRCYEFAKLLNFPT